MRPTHPMSASSSHITHFLLTHHILFLLTHNALFPLKPAFNSTTIYLFITLPKLIKLNPPHKVTQQSILYSSQIAGKIQSVHRSIGT